MSSAADPYIFYSSGPDELGDQEEDLSANLVEATQQLYMRDRRAAERLHLKGCVLEWRTYKSDDAGQDWRSTNPVNFSHRGCGFETKTELEKGQIIWLRITPDPVLTCLNPFFIGAEVRHVKRLGLSFSVGCEFRLDVFKDMSRMRVEESVHRLEQFLRAVHELNQRLAV